MELLNIASFNCKNLNNQSTMNFISSMFYDCQIMLIQEHWLYESQFYLFDRLFSDEICIHGKSSMDPSILRQGRPYGGNAIIWKSSIKNKIDVINTTSKRLTCIQLMMDEHTSILIFNVYMPCDQGYKGDMFTEFQDILAEMHTLMVFNNANYCIVGGDFNTDFAKIKSPYTKELTEYCNQENLIPCIQLPCSDVKYTYECSVTYSTTLIDHFILSDNLKECVKSYSTKNSIDNCSDHCGILLSLDLSCETLKPVQSERAPRVAWYKACLANIEEYQANLDTELSKIYIPTECINCRNISSREHYVDIENLHNEIINACITAASVLPYTKQQSPSDNHNAKRVPGWRDHCATLRQKAIMWHNIWKDAGRPRHGKVADIRRLTRAKYPRAVRYVKANENKLRSERMAECLLNNNTRDFFTEVKKVRRGGSKIPYSVDGAIGSGNIANAFAKKFKCVFNSVNYCDNDMKSLFSRVDEICEKRSHEINECLFDFADIHDVIRHLKSGKSDGNMGLYSDHILHGTDLLFSHLTFLINAMIVHGNGPNDMCTGTIIPIPKGKRANTSISDNFRGICLQSILCKMLDIFILSKEKAKLWTDDLQFGFKNKLSASMATALMTETVDYYLCNGGSVYCLALDATKAFDRVAYVKLFEMLLERQCNIFYIRLLLNMYVDQFLRVRFNNNISDSFKVTNGVKQGGILSPTLFICYVNGLISRLRDHSVGCKIGQNYVGCVSYADDLVLLAPTVAALNEMIEICVKYANEFYIKFNGSKSNLMLFAKEQHKHSPNVFVNSDKVDVVNEMKYLGHMIYNNRQNTMTDYVKKDFISKAKVCLADFNGLGAVVKHNLVDTFCNSFYGLVLCALDSPGFDDICTVWRKVMRRAWDYLPERTVL